MFLLLWMGYSKLCDSLMTVFTWSGNISHCAVLDSIAASTAQYTTHLHIFFSLHVYYGKDVCRGFASLLFVLLLSLHLANLYYITCVFSGRYNDWILLSTTEQQSLSLVYDQLNSGITTCHLMFAIVTKIARTYPLPRFESCFKCCHWGSCVNSHTKVRQTNMDPKGLLKVRYRMCLRTNLELVKKEEL